MYINLLKSQKQVYISVKKIFLAIILFSNLVLSQRKVEEYFPKSPESASLSKSIDIPAGNYSGVANFSIPLYEIDFDGVKVPFSISYHTSGIKLAEISSRVGLGWTLNLGGISVSGQIIGIKEMVPRYILPENFDPNGEHQHFAVTLLDSNIYSSVPQEDIKPDIFSYSTLNSSGEFIFDSSGNFGIPRPYNLDKITRNNSIQIIDESGYKYNFIDEGVILSHTNCSSPPLDNRPLYNYQPKEIVSPTGNQISYNYDNSVSINSKYFTSLIENELIEDLKQGLNDSVDYYIPEPRKKCYAYSTHFERLVNNITFPGGIIKLIYNNPNSEIREDLPQDRFLKKFIVLNTKGDTIKNYTFNYEYFVSNDPIPTTEISGITAGVDKRLKLKNVHDNLINKRHQFSYYNDSLQMPNRMSTSFDYWGVYNGKENSTSIATTLHRKTRLDTNTEVLFVGANKYPDFNFGVTGNLKEIIYPTGGKTAITYEADEFTTEIFTPPIYDYQYKFSDPLGTFGNMTSNAIDFTISNTPYNFNLLFYSDDKPKFSITPREIGDCTLNIYKYPNLTTPIVDSLLTYFPNDYKHNYYNSLTPGTYKMVITSGSDQEIGPYHCYAETQWYEQNILDNSNVRKAGTIRISKIEQKDDNQVKIIREYKYKTPESNYTQTSGKNIGDQYFTSIASSEFPRNENSGWTERLFLTNNPGWALSTFGGKSIGYTNVQEVYTSTTGEKYRKEYLYKNESDGSGNNINPYAFLQSTFPNKDFLRGYLLKESYYNSSLNKVKEIAYEEPHLDQTFNYLSTASPPNSNILMWGLEMHNTIIDCWVEPCTYLFRFEKFSINNYWVKPWKTTITEYINNQPPMVTEKFINYLSVNPPIHTFVKSENEDNSLGGTLLTEYKYPQDLPNEPNVEKLIQANRISSPLVVTTKNNSTVTSEQKTRFKEFTVSTNPIKKLVLPEFVYVKRGELDTNPQIDDRKITYIKYDEKGNLQQYRLENGIDVSIIWGYNGQYPIAKVEGIPYSVIEAQAGILAGNNNLTETSFNALRTIVNSYDPTAMLSCYLYEPLVGVKMIIQPNLQKETYHYDTARRLEFVKDHNGNILKQIDYNYKP